MQSSNILNVRSIFLNKRYDSFTVVFGDIFSLIFYLFKWLSFWILNLYGFNLNFIRVNIWFYLLILSWLFRFILTCFCIILFLWKAWIFTHNPIVMISLAGYLIRAWINDFIHQTEALSSRSGVSLNLKNRLNFDRFLF